MGWWPTSRRVTPNLGSPVRYVDIAGRLGRKIAEFASSRTNPRLLHSFYSTICAERTAARVANTNSPRRWTSPVP